MSQYKYLAEEKALQSRWSKDLCFKRFVQIPQSTYPTSGRTPICHQISKSIPTSPVRNTLKYVFNLLHTYFILCYTVLIKAFVSLCVTKSVASRPCDARDCTGKKRRLKQMDLKEYFTNFTDFTGNQGFSAMEAQWGTIISVVFVGMVKKRGILNAALEEQVPGFLCSRVPFQFSGPTKSGAPVPDPEIETQSLLLGIRIRRIHRESISVWEILGMDDNRYVDPVWAETSVNVAIYIVYECLASSLLLRSLPATSAKRLWLGGSFNCMPFYQDNHNTYKYPLLMYPCSIFGNPQD